MGRADGEGVRLQMKERGRFSFFCPAHFSAKKVGQIQLSLERTDEDWEATASVQSHPVAEGVRAVGVEALLPTGPKFRAK